MSLSGPKSGQLAQLPLLLEDSKRKDEIFLFTQDWVLSLDINRFQNNYHKQLSSISCSSTILYIHALLICIEHCHISIKKANHKYIYMSIFNGKLIAKSLQACFVNHLVHSSGDCIV